MRYICTEDIEDLAAQGKKELVVDENTVVMELARDMARQLGIEIHVGSQPAPAKAPAPAAPSSPPKASSPAVPAASSNGSAFALGAKPKGCQHGPLTALPRPAPATNHQISDGVVNQMVDLVKQSLNKRTGS